MILAKLPPATQEVFKNLPLTDVETMGFEDALTTLLQHYKIDSGIVRRLVSEVQALNDATGFVRFPGVFRVTHQEGKEPRFADLQARTGGYWGESTRTALNLGSAVLTINNQHVYAALLDTGYKVVRW